MEGILHKWTNYFSMYKERYFILSGFILSYFIHKGEHPRGRFHLSVAHIIQGKDDLKFEIDTGQSIFYLKAKCKEDKLKWINELNKVKLQADKLAHINSFTFTGHEGRVQNFLRHNNDHLKYEYKEEDTIYNYLCEIMKVRDDITINNKNIKYLTQDSYLSNEQIIINIISLSDKNDEKLEKLKLLLEETKIKIQNIDRNIKKINEQLNSWKQIIEETNSFSINKSEIHTNKINENFENVKNELNKSDKILFNGSNFSKNNIKKKDFNFINKFNKMHQMDNKYELHHNANKILSSKGDENTLSSNDIDLDLDLNMSIIRKDTDIFYEVKEEPLFQEQEKDFANSSRENHNEINNITSTCLTSKQNNLTTEPELRCLPSFNISHSNCFHNQSNINSRQDFCQSINLPIKDQLVSKFFDPSYSTKRHNLPLPRKKYNFSLWAIIRDAIGKDLSHVTIPVYFNEPLSMLQRLCENFQYANLLNLASNQDNPYLRLAYVGAFCISGFALDPHRTLKFFNPLLGETYEYIDNEQKFRYISEQVSHHPAISACYVEGEAFNFTANTKVKSNFKLFKTTLEFIFLSKCYINFSKYNELISFNKPIAAARNIFSNVYIDCYGKFSVNNMTTGEYAEFQISEAKGLNHQGDLKGEIKSINGEVNMYIEGNWLSHIHAIDRLTGERHVIWTKTKIEGDSESRYFFTDFSINLNNLTEELSSKLPHTDSRFRPDQRALENQDLETATYEKIRLENKQRTRKKEWEKEKFIYKPMYFSELYDEVSGETDFKYTRDYWKDRDNHDFTHLLDIF